MQVSTTAAAALEAATRISPRRVGEAAQLSLGLGRTSLPRVVVVGIGPKPPPTTASLVSELSRLGLMPGEDVIVTRYADLRVGAQRGFVRLADETGAGDRLLAGGGEQALFAFRGGGNLKPVHLSKIAAIGQVDGAAAIADLSFIERAGSKAATFERLSLAGIAQATTLPVRGERQALEAFDAIAGAGAVGGGSSGIAVLKKASSLGGRDVHFVRSEDDVRRVIAADPDSQFVMQEYLPAARDQDVRVHLVWSHQPRDFEVVDAYTRNRAPGRSTPNLANGGFPLPYVLSPWEEHQARAAARALAAGSATPPLHVGLDLFPRAPITPTTIEANQALRDAVAGGRISLDAALQARRNTVVVGEAASSAGTKGSELVRTPGDNPVTRRMAAEIAYMREHGFAQPIALEDAVAGALRVLSPAA